MFLFCRSGFLGLSLEVCGAIGRKRLTGKSVGVGIDGIFYNCGCRIGALAAVLYVR